LPLERAIAEASADSDPRPAVELSSGHHLRTWRPDLASGGSQLTASPPAGLARNTSSLTPREREVALLVARGLTNRQIGEDLVISAATAERHVVNIFNKLGFHSRSQVAAWVVEQKMHTSVQDL